MKPFVVLLLAATIFLNVEMSSAIDWNLQTLINYDWWKDSDGNKGMQGYVPLNIEVRKQEFSLKLLTGYAYTQYKTSLGETRSLSYPLDTKVNLSYEMIDKLPVDLSIGLDFNLPTGKTNLQEKGLVLIMDPDLVSINKFGEGFNFNPTLSVAKQFGKWVGGVGVGYAWRGDYDLSTNIQDLHPGDILTLTAEMRYYFSPQWNARLFGKSAWYNEANWKVLQPVTSNDFWREGNFYNIGMGVNHNEKKWDAGLLLQGTFREKAKFELETIGLFTEGDIKYGNEWLGDLYFRYFIDDKTTLKSNFEYLYRDKNYGSPPLIYFIGRRDKYTLGFGAARVLSKHFQGEAYLKGFYMHDKERLDLESQGSRSYRGFSVGLQLLYKF